MIVSYFVIYISFRISSLTKLQQNTKHGPFESILWQIFKDNADIRKPI